MRAILIPAERDEPIREVDLGEDAYQGIKALLNDGWLEGVSSIRPDVTPYVDEEGKIKGLPVNFRATALLGPAIVGDFLVGNCVLTTTDAEGETVALVDDVTIEWVEERV